MIVLTLTKPMGENVIVFVLLAVSLGIMLILNIISTLLYCLYTERTKSKQLSKYSYATIAIISTFITLSCYHLLNTKLYNFVSITIPQNQPFWLWHSRLSKISIISQLLFVATGVMLVFNLTETASYLYFSSMELVILAIVDMVVMFLAVIWPIDYSVT
jgi:hypothetical protein